MSPDVAWVFVHLFLHLGQYDGNTLVSEQTVAAGALINVPEIHIPPGSITVQFQDAADERIRIATGRTGKVIFIFRCFKPLMAFWSEDFLIPVSRMMVSMLGQQ